MELTFASLATKSVRKKGVICQVIMFTPIPMVFKLSKIAGFFVFSADNSKMFVTVWEIYISTQRRY